MNVTPLTIEGWACRAPENLCICTDGELIELCQRAGCDLSALGAGLGELVVRWLIGDSGGRSSDSLEGRICGLLPQGRFPERLVVAKLKGCPSSEASETLAAVRAQWASSDPEVGEMISSRLETLLCRTDGFVPVFDSNDGRSVFIPFQLLSRAKSDEGFAIDSAGELIKGWNGPAGQVLAGSEWRMKVHFRQRKDAPCLCETSFMLPLLVARCLRERALPDFVRWQLLFTGSIAPDGCVCPVRTEEKAAGVEARFQKDVRLVSPSDSEFADELRSVDPIRTGICGEDLIDALRCKIEALSTCRMSRDYALSRLPDFDRELRHETLGEWDRQIARVDAMLKVLGRYSAPRQYLQLLMLKSAAYCHSGRTALALQENRRAKEFAEANGLVYEALRLAIEELVEFQDSQRFDEIGELSTSIEERISSAKLSETERHDLRMRFCGTIGQVQMERGLLKLDAAAPNCARRLLNQAMESARELERLDRGRHDGDVLQDLNYMHLWHVFFDPASSDLKELAEEMRRNCQGLASDGEKVKNAAYEARQEMLYAYLRWKKSGEVPDDWELLPPPGRGSDSWLMSSFMKMKGALLAASGKGEEAAEAFERGDNALPKRDWWKSDEDVLSAGGVFAQIRLELLVQAFCSLVAVGLTDKSEGYRRQGLALIEELPNVRKRVGVSGLEALLKHRGVPDPRALPVLYY